MKGGHFLVKALGPKICYLVKGQKSKVVFLKKKIPPLYGASFANRLKLLACDAWWFSCKYNVVSRAPCEYVV